AVSDIALKRELPEQLAKSVAAYVGCVAGAITFEEYERGLKAAGFESVQIVDTRKDLNAYTKVENQSACCSPAMDVASSTLPLAGCREPASTVHEGLADLLQKYDVNDYAASVQVFALKAR